MSLQNRLELIRTHQVLGLDRPVLHTTWTGQALLGLRFTRETAVINLKVRCSKENQVCGSFVSRALQQAIQTSIWGASYT